jgi:hypothetical protein
MSLTRLDQGVDHIYSTHQPYQPVVINTAIVVAPSTTALVGWENVGDSGSGIDGVDQCIIDTT